MSSIRWSCLFTFAALLGSAPGLGAATVYVAAGGDLQKALDAAQPGDTILLAENAEFVGNFVLPVKTGDAWITLRSAAPDTALPAAGVRVRPADRSLLARLRSPNTAAALRTAPGAHHWSLRYLEFAGNQNGFGDILQVGDGSSAQNSMAKVPHHLVLKHLYVHGDPRLGQKRCIALNAAHTTISDSYVADCKAVGQDSQAIGGWNGPGPYTIENNYLEGAGENVLLGGADPSITDLVADGVTFRRNHVARPMSWRSPIIGTPGAVTAAVVSGGSLPAGTYAYRIVARGSVGTGTTGRSTASAEVTVTTTAAATGVRVTWQPVSGATEYRVYGRTPAAENIYWSVTRTEFVDTGASGISEAVPTSTGTVWSVKNLFELKNARNVVVENNIFENHWKESQPGYAIVFTPRNSNGSCTWCVIENVQFRHNIVRNVAGGINVLGYDSPSSPSRQTTNISFSHNLFTRMSTSLGGNGWFMLIGDEPRNIRVTHNTIDSNGATLVYAYGGTSTDPREIPGFEMTANASRHGTYGMGGQYFPYGNALLAGYYPGAVFSSNYLSGAPLSRYPAGTLSAGVFTEQFIDAANGNYSPRPGGALDGGAADGSDIGADMAALAAAIEGVEAGRMPGEGGRPDPPVGVAPVADFNSSCSFLSCTFTNASTGAIVQSTFDFGDGASAGGAGVHVFGAAGSYIVKLDVLDANGLAGTVSKTVVVEAPIPATVALALSCTYLQCSYADTSTAGSGAISARDWDFGDGAASQNGGASGTHVFAAAGTYTVVLRVSDVNGLSATASRTVTVRAPNVAPLAAFTQVCANLTCTLTDVSSDVDGRIVAWSWNSVAGVAHGPVAAVTFPAAGTYEVSLTVTDDDGATATRIASAQVVGELHAAYSGTSRWTSPSGAKNHWSAEVALVIHGGNERAVGGATVMAAWTGAAVKTVTCVTNDNGVCTLKSGTLSYGRSNVTLTVTSVVSPQGVYTASANHVGAAASRALTLVRP